MGNGNPIFGKLFKILGAEPTTSTYSPMFSGTYFLKKIQSKLNIDLSIPPNQKPIRRISNHTK